MSEVLDLLRHGDLRPLGRIVGSSNSAVLVEVTRGSQRSLAIHKPVAFERPLWDYPDGDLAHRELAAYLISRAAGFDVVPVTVLRDGPWGSGSLQQWVGGPDDDPELVVTVCSPQDRPAGWVSVLEGEDEDGTPVVLAHDPQDDVRSAAVLDAVLNNSDRKGLHLVRIPDGLRGFDHGVSLGAEPKLRTVLWGWAGQPLPATDVTRLEKLRVALAQDPLRAELGDCLTPAEIEALGHRVEVLLTTGCHPLPTPGWPAIPWPAM